MRPEEYARAGAGVPPHHHHHGGSHHRSRVKTTAIGNLNESREHDNVHDALQYAEKLLNEPGSGQTVTVTNPGYIE